MQNEPNFGNRLSALEQSLQRLDQLDLQCQHQLEQQALTCGSRLMRTPAHELLHLAYGDQPQYPGGGTPCFQDLAAENDSRLTAYTTRLNQLHSTQNTPPRTPPRTWLLSWLTLLTRVTTRHYITIHGCSRKQISQKSRHDGNMSTLSSPCPQ